MNNIGLSVHNAVLNYSRIPFGKETPHPYDNESPCDLGYPNVTRRSYTQIPIRSVILQVLDRVLCSLSLMLSFPVCGSPE